MRGQDLRNLVLKPTFHKFLIFFFLLLSLKLNLGCSRFRGEKEVLRVCDEMVEAFNKGDAEAYFGFFSKDYKDEDFGFQEGRKSFELELSQKLKPTLTVLERKVSFKQDRAEVWERFRLEGLIQEKPRHYVEEQNLVFEQDENKGWKLIRGSEVYRILAFRAKEEDLILKTIEDRVRSINQKDLTVFQSVISDSYNMNGKTKEDLVGEMKENFQAYDWIKFEVYEPKINFLGGKNVIVVERFRLSGSYQGKNVEYKEYERLGLTKEGGGWKIIGGL